MSSTHETFQNHLQTTRLKTPAGIKVQLLVAFKRRQLVYSPVLWNVWRPAAEESLTVLLRTFTDR